MGNNKKKKLHIRICENDKSTDLSLKNTQLNFKNANWIVITW